MDSTHLHDKIHDRENTSYAEINVSTSAVFGHVNSQGVNENCVEKYQEGEKRSYADVKPRNSSSVRPYDPQFHQYLMPIDADFIML